MESEDFSYVWQHFSGLQWKTYTDEHIKTINSALKRKKKTVTLQGKTPKLIIFDDLVQQNKTSIKEKIRPLIFSSGFFSWMYKENNNFYSYKYNIVFMLEVAYQRKEMVFKYYDDGDFIIDLKTYQERNEETCEFKSVIREEVNFPSLTSELFNISLDSHAFMRMCRTAPLNFETRYMNLPASTSKMSRMLDSLTIDVKSLSKIDVSDSLNIRTTVDHLCPHNQDFQVISKNNIYYSATLSLVKLQSNKNKFYILQLLQHKRNGYKIYIRSGRIGTDGSFQLKDFISLENAKKEFEKIFYEKTNNVFQEKVFNYVIGKYNLLRVDWNPKPKKMPWKIELDYPLQSLLEMICNEEIFDVILKEMYYDSSCVPLGELTIAQIKCGYSILNKIANLLSVSSGSSGIDLINACDEFYSTIPHNFGKKCSPLIQTQKDIKDKLEMLETLFNIRIALKAMYEDFTSSSALIHPFTHFYQKLSYSLELIDPSTNAYIEIEKCFKETCGPSHTTYDLQILDIFACHNKHTDNINKECNKLLLWHGSRMTNWAGILKEGLRVAPPEAPSTGSMFGKGIYFADICTKSANYCLPTRKVNEGLLLMCEVAVGNMLSLLKEDPSLPQSLPPHYDSVFAKGKIGPSNFKSGILSHKAKAPFGPLVEDKEIETNLLYNEYVIYDSKKVLIKYILRLRFNFK